MQFLIAGLGNPDEQYQHTRHNIGFDIIDQLCQKHNTEAELSRYAWYAKASVKGRKLHLIMPNTYMNRSGLAVRYWLQECRIPVENLLVVTDDVNLPPGKIRIRAKGSDGGHNGLRNIIEVLNRSDFPRLRFGAGGDYPKGKQVDHVLSRWKDEEKETVEQSIDVACDAIHSFALQGISGTMTKYNR